MHWITERSALIKFSTSAYGKNIFHCFIYRKIMPIFYFLFLVFIFTVIDDYVSSFSPWKNTGMGNPRVIKNKRYKVTFESHDIYIYMNTNLSKICLIYFSFHVLPLVIDRILCQLKKKKMKKADLKLLFGFWYQDSNISLSFWLVSS